MYYIFTKNIVDFVTREIIIIICFFFHNIVSLLFKICLEIGNLERLHSGLPEIVYFLMPAKYFFLTTFSSRSFAGDHNVKRKYEKQYLNLVIYIVYTLCVDCGYYIHGLNY